MQELERRKEIIIRNRSKAPQQKDKFVVRCECDHGMEEGNMVGRHRMLRS